MQRILLVAAFSAACAAAHAQNAISAGTVALGGSIGYSRSSDEESQKSGSTNYTAQTKSSRFSFAPSVGYFVADNLAVGLSASYSANGKDYTTYTPTPATVRTELDPTTRLRVGPFVQYYKMVSDQFGLVGTLGGGYQNYRDQFYSGNGNSAVVATQKGSGYYVALTPAVIFFPIPKLGLSASIGSIGYDRLSYDFPTTGGGNNAPSDYKNIQSEFGANFGLSQLQFGGTYFFGR